MPALQVRDFPEELYLGLREKARFEHRSISQQTVVAIRAYLSGQTCANALANEEVDHQRRAAKREALFARIGARPPHKVPDGFPSIEEIVREMRDSR